MWSSFVSCICLCFREKKNNKYGMSYDTCEITNTFTHVREPNKEEILDRDKWEFFYFLNVFFVFFVNLFGWKLMVITSR